MPSPLAIIVGAGAIGISSNILNQYWSTYVTPTFQPTTYANTLIAWENDPCLEPEPSQLISMWQKGFLIPDGFRQAMDNHGVNLPVDWHTVDWSQNMPWKQSLWTRFMASTETPLPIELMYRKWKLGEITEAELDRHLKLHAYRKNESRAILKNPHNIPTVAEAVILHYRKLIDANQFHKYLEANGINALDEREMWRKSGKWIPGPGDIISFAVKEAFNPEIVNRFQYDAEFPSLLTNLMELQGADWTPREIGIAVPDEQNIPLPRMFWRSHWQVISPTQAMDAVHRARPIAPGSNISRIAGIQPFTRDDFDLILKTADYPPIMREWLFGLSFTPLSRIDIRRFSRLLPWTRQDILERYRDLGYSEADAGVQADFTIAERHAAETARDRARVETVIRQLYEECVYSSGEAAAALKAARLKTPAQQAEFGALPTAEQQAQGLADQAISYLIGSLDAKKKLNLAKKTKSAVRSAVLRREIDLGTAQLLLAAAGITGNCATELLQLWQLEMQIKGKQATASQILRWFVKGAITGQEVALRLSLMGYSNRDITAMLAVAGQDISLAVARQRKQLATDERGRLQAIRNELRLLRQQRKEAIADLNASATKAQIIKFYSANLVSREEALAALIQRGVFPRDAELFLEDVDNAKSKVSDKIQSEPPSNGQAGKSGNQGTQGGNPEL